MSRELLEELYTPETVQHMTDPKTFKESVEDYFNFIKPDLEIAKRNKENDIIWVGIEQDTSNTPGIDEVSHEDLPTSNLFMYLSDEYSLLDNGKVMNFAEFYADLAYDFDNDNQMLYETTDEFIMPNYEIHTTEREPFKGKVDRYYDYANVPQFASEEPIDNPADFLENLKADYPEVYKDLTTNSAGKFFLYNAQLNVTRVLPKFFNKFLSMMIIEEMDKYLVSTGRKPITDYLSDEVY